MRTSVSLMRSLLVILGLCFLASGCGRAFQQGHQCGLEYRTREVPAYELVIMLHSMSEQDQDAFLQGFGKAYKDAGDGRQGREYVRVLRQSLEGGFYEKAVEQGMNYVNGRATDTGIQELISSSVGLSQGAGLGWKAGYIAGFAREMVRRKPELSEQQYYRHGETKYNALRGALGV